VTKGTQYWIGWDSDTTSGNWSIQSAAAGFTSTTAYSSFPVASPSGSAAAGPVCTLTQTIGSNATLVNEAQQDGTTSYVYDSTVNDADLYTIASLTPQPASVVAVTTRGFIEKSDAGTRTGTVQLKSSSTTVAAPTATLSTSFGWVWRIDTTDPHTSATWTASAVDGAQIGPKVIS
jgi:hypothetical protein